MDRGSPQPGEGRRARKRAETRARILTAARELFLAQGFDATTIDQIVERADISKRSFFDYFPAKEDLIAAWQDAFGDLLVAKVAARPEGEPLGRTVEAAMSGAIAESVSPEGIEMDRLVRETPSLRARMHLKYARMEARLAEALERRAPMSSGAEAMLLSEPALLAMLAVGLLRLGSEAWTATARHLRPEAYTHQVFDQARLCLAKLAQADEDQTTPQ